MRILGRRYVICSVGILEDLQLSNSSYIGADIRCDIPRLQLHPSHQHHTCALEMEECRVKSFSIRYTSNNKNTSIFKFPYQMRLLRYTTINSYFFFFFLYFLRSSLFWPDRVRKRGGCLNMCVSAKKCLLYIFVLFFRSHRSCDVNMRRIYR